MGHGCWQNRDGTFHTPDVGVTLDDVLMLDEKKTTTEEYLRGLAYQSKTGPRVEGTRADFEDFMDLIEMLKARDDESAARRSGRNWPPAKTGIRFEPE